MRTSQAEAIAAISRIAEARTGTVWVGVDGYGGSGKTTFAARLAAEAPGTVVVHVDDFAGPRVSEWDWGRFRAQVLLPLLDRRPARYQRWDWDRDEGAEWHEIAPGSVVVVEGVSSTRREAGVPWAATVWVEAPRDLRLARAVERDGVRMLPRWLTDWMPSEEAYAAREDPVSRVDFIVSGDEQY